MSDLTLFETFLCGGFGGVCSILIGHPLDTVKVRLQTMPVTKPGEQPHYLGTIDCLKKMIKLEGIRGPYKGMLTPLLGVSPIFALSFMGFGWGKQLFCPEHIKDHKYNQYFLAGAFSGVFTTLIMAPGERIKCLLQIQEGGKSQFAGPLDVVKKSYRQGGVRTLFCGFGATLLRDVPASGVYYLTYQGLQNYFTNNGTQSVTVMTTIFSGGIAGVTNWMVGMPADVLKSRLQTAPHGKYPNGLRDVFIELYKTEGLSAMYKGIVPILLRAFPANAACFLGFEFIKELLLDLKKKRQND